MTKLINQRGHWDCTIASMAMFAKCSYLDVLKEFLSLYPNHRRNGLSTREMFKVLRAFEIKPFQTNVIFFDIKGIMDVPSLNDLNGVHSVFFDGNKILDPNYKLRGKLYYDKKKLKKVSMTTLITVDMNDKATKELYQSLTKVK